MGFLNDKNDKDRERETILKKMKRNIVNDWIGRL